VKRAHSESVDDASWSMAAHCTLAAEPGAQTSKVSVAADRITNLEPHVGQQCCVRAPTSECPWGPGMGHSEASSVWFRKHRTPAKYI